MSKQYQTRPSSLLGLQSESDYLAYCLDEAVFHFGMAIESALNEAEQGNKTADQVQAARERIIKHYLSDSVPIDEGSIQKGGQVQRKPSSGFADPAALLHKG